MSPTYCMPGRAWNAAVSALLLLAVINPPLNAADNWTGVNERVKPSVYQLNVAIKAKLKDGQYAQLAALSPRRHYPVFATVPQDQGFRVVGYGSCFPVAAGKQDKTYLLTNKHVIDFGDGMLQECQRFYAGMRLYAERSAGFINPDQRYKDLLRIVNSCMKKDRSSAEKTVYDATVDTIWDTYDDHLSLKADPTRAEFKRCLAKTGFSGAVGYFVHKPGKVQQPPIVASLYKAARSEQEPDLAVLSVSKAGGALELDSGALAAGQPIEAVGYPLSAKNGKLSVASYTPSFTPGRITRVSRSLVRFDAGVSKGDSGGPLINHKGKVIGVVTRRAMPDVNTDRFAGAISVAAVKDFVPELFQRKR